jgi:hypothetical protein
MRITNTVSASNNFFNYVTYLNAIYKIESSALIKPEFYIKRSKQNQCDTFEQKMSSAVTGDSNNRTSLWRGLLVLACVRHDDVGVSQGADHIGVFGQQLGCFCVEHS